MFREALMEARGGAGRNRGGRTGEDDSVAATPTSRSGSATPPLSGRRSPGGASAPSRASGFAGPADTGGFAVSRGELGIPGTEPAPPSATPSAKMPRAFPSEIDMLVKDHGEVEDPELMDVRRLRRESTRTGLNLHSDRTSSIDKGHASLASIFDLADLASPSSPGDAAAVQAGASEIADAKAAKKAPAMPTIPGSPASGAPGAASAEEVRLDLSSRDATGEEAEKTKTAPTPLVMNETETETETGTETEVRPPRRKRAVSFSFGKDETRVYTPRPETPAEAPASWVTDASGPAALNRIIREKSEDAQLVIVNLPDPDSLVMANPAAYARYVEAIVRGLPRVVYVHGTGREVYTNAS